jgi:Ca2+-binding RTX toxin-like protein
MKRLAPLCALMLAAIPVGTAAAADVQVGVAADGTTRVLYRAAPGEANAPQLTSSPFAQSFVDFGAPLVAGAGCVPGPPVQCGPFPIQADLGDRDDVASINSFIGNSIVDAGSGDDDVLAGGNTDTTAYGGSGDDTIRVTTDGQANAFGGSGDDRIGGGFSQVIDVFAGEGGDDLLVSAARGSLDGGAGDDDLVSSGFGITLNGGSGNDVIVARSGTVLGGKGSDIVSGHGGVLTVDAGPGTDVVDVFDGDPGAAPDTVSCGSGLDVAWVDANDNVSRDCEIRIHAKGLDLPQVARANAHAHALLAHLPHPGGA